MERKFKENFSDIDEELSWQFFKMSEGNPYIAQDLVQQRNRERENLRGKNL